MPTQKIDPKVIFASNAPAIDNPPVFGDKTKGWDVSRTNNGRPKIPQMNKVQQDTDLKILWLNENAVLPYDASIDYADGVVVLKDGEFQKKTSDGWVSFNKSKPYILEYYKTGEAYPLNARIMLANGDIVQSTIPNNTNNPNTNMNGWVLSGSASYIKYSNGQSLQYVNDFDLFKSLEYFGAKGGSVNDQDVVTSLGNNYSYVLGKTYNVPCWNSQATKFIGNGTTINVDAGNGSSTVAVQIRDNSNYSDISFVNDRSLLKQWTYSVIGNNSILTNCGFYNFDDLEDVKNSWGIFLENRKNITLNGCHFGGNGVSDIAIVDGVYDITMNNLRNIQDNGVYLDIEPNQTGSNKDNIVSGIMINGGKYRHISLLDNSFVNYGIGNVSIRDAEVDLIELRGGILSVDNSNLKDIKGNWYPFKDFQNFQNEYFSQLRISSANLSKNLIEDPQIFDLTLGSSTSYWSVYAPNNLEIQRVSDSNGVYLSINKSKLYETIISSRDFIVIPFGTKHICTSITHGVNNGSDSNFNTVYVELYNSSNTLIETLSYKGCRVDSNSSMPLRTEQGVFRIPDNLSVAKAKIILKCKAGSEYLVSNVGLYTLSLTKSNGNFNDTIDNFSKTQTNLSYKSKEIPSDYRGAISGQTLTTPDSSVYIFNGSSFIKINSLKKYFTSSSQPINLPIGSTNPTSLIRDLSFSGVLMGQTVRVASTTRLGDSVDISATVTSEGIIRLLVVNFGAEIDTSSVFNFIVE